jgi:hypothetical protein
MGRVRPLERVDASASSLSTVRLQLATLACASGIPSVTSVIQLLQEAVSDRTEAAAAARVAAEPRAERAEEAAASSLTKATVDLGASCRPEYRRKAVTAEHTSRQSENKWGELATENRATRQACRSSQPHSASLQQKFDPLTSLFICMSVVLDCCTPPLKLVFSLEV